MTRPVRIGNAHGFWGDRLDAAAEMLALEPELDFLTLDFLAEVSMSILAVQRSRDPAAGWPRDFAEIVRSIVPIWRGGGRCRIVTNAGGLNPAGCAGRAAKSCRPPDALTGRSPSFAVTTLPNWFVWAMQTTICFGTWIPAARLPTSPTASSRPTLI